VELLVVIGIIGAITAIAVPTIFGAIASARNAKTKAEIDMLHMALMTYKNEYGSFPPANMGPTDPANPNTSLWLTSANPPMVNTSHPVYKHLARVFPRLSENLWDNQNFPGDSPYKYLGQLSPAQALVFWLQGFYDDPELPLTNRYTPGTRKKLFDFNQARLYAASSYDFAGTAQTFSAPTSPTPLPRLLYRSPFLWPSLRVL
jgi:type II secretory pathway pseudopilin PulG